MPLTIKEYESACRDALGQVHVLEHEFTDDTMADYDPATKTIRIDTMWGGSMPLLVHELMHHIYYHKLGNLGVMEEPTTEAWEARINKHIFHVAVKRKWWRRALKAKLAEAA